MEFPFTFTCAASKAKDINGSRLVEITGMAAGMGIFRFWTAEKNVPDNLEGKIVKAIFGIGVDRNFKLVLRFKGIEGYAN